MDLVTEQKLERRERIIREARELIAERGYQNVTVRELAERCRVSVPTLYNLFGGKGELLQAAVESQLHDVLATFEPSESGQGGLPLVDLVERCAQEMARLSDYHRSLLRAFAGAGETGQLQETLAGRLAAALASELRAMQKQRQLEPWVSADTLAGQLTAACISSSVIWAHGGLGDAGLRASMVYAACLLLLGPARGAARKALRERAEAAQAALEDEVASRSADRALG
ncbi:MAG: hypothetical protein CL910_06560 [Deltaproteobacteria bacterium]|nr:hypothetical protein [Deltaproteobacteria bacterium]